MTIEDLLKLLKIDKVGVYSKSKEYVIDLDNDTDFGRIYSKLDDNDALEYLENSSLLTVDNASLNYDYSDEFRLTLIADFNNEKYQLVVKQN